jgi:hypothetical protein
MSALRFVPLGGPSDLNEVLEGTAVFGIVWRLGEVWHGDPANMSNPLVMAASRQRAGERLVAALQSTGRP